METRTLTLSAPWATIITIIFVILKLTGSIAWSWWWVFSPLWIVIAIVILIVLGAFLASIFSYK
jgi:hypothetical protein